MSSTRIVAQLAPSYWGRVHTDLSTLRRVSCDRAMNTSCLIVAICRQILLSIMSYAAERA